MGLGAGMQQSTYEAVSRDVLVGYFCTGAYDVIIGAAASPSESQEKRQR